MDLLVRSHHHRLETMWLTCRRQILDPSKRYSEAEMNGGNYGHLTWANEPPSRKAKFSDVIDMGYAGENTTIGNVMSTLSGPFCYFYL